MVDPGKEKVEERQTRSPSFYLVLTAVLAATLAAVKFALAWLPNIEGVTFLIIVFTAVFGLKIGGGAALIFALTDGMIYGYGYYTVSYLIQYPGVALVTALISPRGMRSEYVYTAAALVMSTFFGVHTALLDSLAFGYPFWPRYLSGILFYAANILSASLLTLFAFKPLSRLLIRYK